MVNRKCTFCKIVKPIIEFDKCSKTKMGVRSKCKRCRHLTERVAVNLKVRHANIRYYKNNKKNIKKKVNIWTKKNPEKVKINKRSSGIRKYGLTLEQYKTLYRNQNGKCKICNTKPSILAVDHDHDTGKVRGLLCKKCNSGIGFLNDSIELIKKALEYLLETSTIEKDSRRTI